MKKTRPTRSETSLVVSPKVVTDPARPQIEVVVPLHELRTDLHAIFEAAEYCMYNFLHVGERG